MAEQLMICAFLAAMLLGLAPVAGGTIWQVEWDPNDTVDRVGRVVAQAASGDTIEIGPGVYSEHIPIDGKSLTLIGVDGPDQTVLDGATEIPGREGSILYALDDYAAALRLRGLTLRGGTGTLVFGRWPRGGAVYLANDGPGIASLDIEACRFESNRAEGPDATSGSGGAIYVGGGPDARIVECEFVDNYARSSGGAVSVEGYSAEIRGCRFELSSRQVYEGSAIQVYGMGDHIILDNTFLSTGNLPLAGTCVWSQSMDLTLRGNTFLAQGSTHACRLFLSVPAGWGSGNVDLILENNRFWTDVVSENRVIEILIERDSGVTRLSGNVLVRCPVYVDGGWPTVIVDHNIFFGGSVYLFRGSARCNVSWPDSIESYPGALETEKNVVADPLFCEDAPGAFEVSGLSPCRPTHSDGCGVIGGVEVGCDFEPVERTSWGKLKNLFPGSR